MMNYAVWCATYPGVNGGVRGTLDTFIRFENVS